MYARYLQVNVCVGFSVCWGSKPVVALLSDHVSVCPHHPPMSTRAVLRACAFTVCYHTYPRSVAPPPLSALVSGIWIDGLNPVRKPIDRRRYCHLCHIMTVP